MKVLLIDPWGLKNTSEYLNGLIWGLSPLVELTVFTNCRFEQYTNANSQLFKVFFPKSETMKSGLKRKLLRGVEYCQAYCQIINFLRKNRNFDIIHINWLLDYDIDIYFLYELRKYCKQLVYTAHNVIPHVNGQDSIHSLSKIYAKTDIIVVHGNQIKSELVRIFPETSQKIYVQRHGCILRQPQISQPIILPDDIRRKLDAYPRKLIFFGAIFPNKGVDRIAKCWLLDHKTENALLIIAGKTAADYPELTSLNMELAKTKNVLIINEYLEDSVLNLLISYSDAVLLPYCHASMSGVIFTAAQFEKPVLCTDTGALPEYIEPGYDSVLCENSEKGVSNGVKELLSIEQERLAQMGRNLHKNIALKCDWNLICGGLVRDVYSKMQ